MSTQGRDDRLVIQVDRDLKVLVPQFLANRRADVETVRQALQRSDYESIRVLGHQMKGTGSGYGFDAITAIGTALEHAARAGDASTIQRCAGELTAYLERVEVV